MIGQKIHFLKTGSKKKINLRNVRDVRYATKPELSSAGRSAVVDHGKGNDDALKEVLDFFKKPLSVKQTTVMCRR